MRVKAIIYRYLLLFRKLKIIYSILSYSACFILCISWFHFAADVNTELNFNEGAGTTTADESGAAHNGTLVNGPTWVTGKYGPAINFDGADDYVNIANHADYTLTADQNYTWSAWVKNNNMNQWGTVWSQTADANNYFYFYAHSSTDADAGPVTNGVSVYWYNGANRLVIHSNNNVLTTGTWSYITVTYEGSLAQASRVTIYINGTDVTDRADIVSEGALTSVNPANIRIGSNQPFGDYINAAIDEVRYYTRLLTPEEILSDMETPIDNTAPSIIVSAPSNGSTVNGTINVTATASDVVGVTGVQFLLDEVELGAEDITAPYSVSLNTTTLSDGSHTLTAKASDLVGNIGTSSTVTFTVNNDLTPPTITLTAPAPGIIIGTVDIEATASDNNSVAGVQFLLNGVNLGQEDVTAPYSFSWNTTDVTDGHYVLTARARDAGGNTTTTANLNVVVHNMPDVQAPVITLTAPADGIISGTINITANATDNIDVAGVQFKLNGVDLGVEQLTAPYSFSWNTTTVADGHYVLTATATDEAGNTTTTTNVNVTVYNNADTQAPTISLTAPTAGNVAGIVDINANASDNIAVAGVQFLLNGANLGAEVISAPYSVSWNTTSIADGHYIITARARDLAGNLTTTGNLLVTVKNDAQAPTVTLTNPAAGTVSNTIIVSADASDNINVSGVQFLLNGSNLGIEDVTPPYSISWNTRTIANGNYTLTARARDASGNIQISAPVAVTVSNIPQDTEYPVVSITSPSSGNTTGTISVTANATDNIGVVGVQFYLNGSDFGDEDLTAPYTFSWNTRTVDNGSYTLTATARDAAGNITASTAVVITINNPVDAELPVVTITAPAAGNVTGTISVTANATDNIGIEGVQFLLDGNSLGNEDMTAPYSVIWNTATSTAGNHILSAVARDLSGNTSIVTYRSVNVIIITPPVVSGITAGSITANSAVITWNTNVPSTSQVYFDLTAPGKFSTLVDSSLVTSHSMMLMSLAPGTVYHYQTYSSDANGITVSTDKTFTTASLAASPGSLNQHTVFAYPSNKIVPWTANPTDGYNTVMDLAWNYLLNSVPNDPSTGKPAYYSRSYLDPNTQQVIDWPHNPAGLYAMLTESALKYYEYTANANVVQLANNVALWHLDHGMTSTNDNWPAVPYASGDVATLNYNGADVGNSNGQGDGDGYIEPDKIGELGNAWLQLYKYGGNIRFRDAAIQAGTVLSNKVRAGTINQSPWPFRVNAHSGTIREEYCSNIIAPISLLDNLIAGGFGDTAAYKIARNTAWTWMMTYPMQNNVWSQYFEDVPMASSYNSNLNQYNAMMVARYLLEHPEMDASWEAHARGLITWVETTFSQSNFGATTAREQQEFFYAMGSHTSRYASVCALLYEKTGDQAAKEKAYRAFNWATYMARTNGVVIDGPEVNNQWFSDGYGDYIRHFMTGLAAVPEWVPFTQTHLLRSTSVVKNVSYGINNVSYTTYDERSTEVLHLNFNPVTVMADDVILPHRSDLNQPGWTLDIATKTFKVYHTSGTKISISVGDAKSTCPGENIYFTLADQGAGYSYQWQVDSTGSGFVNLSGNSFHTGITTDTLKIIAPPTSFYGYKYRCIATRSGVPLTGPAYVLKFSVKWEGAESGAWENPSNWSCNYVPDAKTDVIIPAGPGNNPLIGNDVTVKSITLSPGSALTVAQGVKVDITGK